MTTLLPNFPLPLPSPNPPVGFMPSHHQPALSAASDTTAFNTGLEDRDRFQGVHRCVVCGVRASGSSGISPLKHCHIIPKSEPATWLDLKTRAYIPGVCKSVEHESRNGVLMCSNHHNLFVEYTFYIRFDPVSQKYYVISHAGLPDMARFHGKAIPLEHDHVRAPYPSIFLIHEARVRGRWPFAPTQPEVMRDVYQDWVNNARLIDSNGRLDRNAPVPPQAPASSAPPAATSNAPPQGPDGQNRSLTTILPSLEQAFNMIFEEQKRMPTWFATAVENESWDGTGKENVAKYLALKDAMNPPYSSEHAADDE